MWSFIVFMTGALGAVMYLIADAGTVERVTPVDTSSPGPESDERRRGELFGSILEAVEKNETVTEADLVDEFYPQYSLGFDSRSEWWRRLVVPFLRGTGDFDRVAETEDTEPVGTPGTGPDTGEVDGNAVEELDPVKPAVAGQLYEAGYATVADVEAASVSDIARVRGVNDLMAASIKSAASARLSENEAE